MCVFAPVNPQEDDDEDEDAEEADKAAAAQANNDGSDGENEDAGAKPAAKQKRTLGFSAAAVTPSADTPGGKKGGSRKKPAAPWESPREGARVPGGGGGGVRGSDVLLPGDDDDGASGVMAHQRTYTGSFSSGGRSRAAAGGCWGWVRRLMFR